MEWGGGFRLSWFHISAWNSTKATLERAALPTVNHCVVPMLCCLQRFPTGHQNCVDLVFIIPGHSSSMTEAEMFSLEDDLAVPSILKLKTCRSGRNEWEQERTSFMEESDTSPPGSSLFSWLLSTSQVQTDTACTTADSLLFSVP